LPAGIELITKTTVAKILPEQQQVVDQEGKRIAYDKLLLATGGAPKKLPFDHDNQILYYRTLNDYRRLRQLTQTYDRFVVVGGGFIGSEIGAALAMNGKDVTMIFPEPGICAQIFPEALSGFVGRHFESKGVTLLPKQEIQSFSGHVGNFWIESTNGQEIRADVIVAGIGIEPNTRLAAEAGLDVDDGVLVDNRLRTSDPHIYAAGDVANFFDPILGDRRRVEHEDNANKMGETVGRIMAGQDASYDYTPFFYSDLFDLGYEAVGKLDATLETVADWKKPYEKGVVYYLKDQRIRGILLWNVWDRVQQARELIAKGDVLHPDNLRGMIGDWGSLEEALEESFPASDPPATW
jgi:NADPH-dependent 2,4-dienoyl-CoA reductase/sulfur reductase-like enzyme